MEMSAMLREAKRGDRRALEALCAHFHPRLCRYAYALTRSREAAEDAAQETLVAMLRALPDFRGCDMGKFEGWLLRIERNHIYSQVRRKRPEPIPEGFDPPDSAPPPGEQLERAERRQSVLKALDSLDAQMREMVILRYEMELSYAQIAVAMNVSATRVKWRLHDAREKLRALLGDEDV